MAAQRLIAEKLTVDVGKTGYEQPVTAVFSFRNKSSRKLRIVSVRPDCNCTVVDYPKGDIADKFQVKMTFDARQLGHFDKQAAIVTNASAKPVYIRMRGLVLADYQDMSDTYPVAMGDLLLDKAELEFDDINRGDVQVQELHVYNDGTMTYRPNLMHLPSYLTATTTPERLSPGTAGTMRVTLNSTLLHSFGLTQSPIYLAANPGDTVSAEREIMVSAVLLPAFTHMTDEQRQLAPVMQLSKKQVDIRFDGKKKRTEVIEVSNGGRSDLTISSLQLFTRGLVVSLGKRQLRPGEKTKLKVTALRDDILKVRARPRILMITNDPTQPKITININTH